MNAPPSRADLFDTDGETARFADVLIANQNNFMDKLWMLGARPLGSFVIPGDIRLWEGGEEPCYPCVLFDFWLLTSDFR